MRLRRAVGAGVAVVLLGGAAVACRQLVGIKDDPPKQLGPAGCGLPFTGDCASCVAASCCDLASACAADPSCAPYAGCLASCTGDPTCRAKCTYDNQPIATSAAFPPLAACLATKCESECGLTCGGLVGSYSSPDAASACQDCMAKNACTAEQECARSSDCETAGLCNLSCEGRFDCNAGCAEGNDAGFGPFESLAMTFEGTCGAECGGGQNWGCAGHVSWPSPQGASTDVHYTIHDSDGVTPVPGIQVALCSESGTCGPVLGQSDAGGVVDVTVPIPGFGTAGQGPRGYLLLTTPDDAGDASIVPDLVYWGAPLGQARLNGNVNVTTLQELVEISQNVNLQQDPTRGYVTVTAVDCLGTLAPGVVFDVEPKDALTQTFYLESNTVGTTATQTDRSGFAVVANVPAGSVHLTARSLSLEATVSQADVLVQAQRITNVAMVPSP